MYYVFVCCCVKHPHLISFSPRLSSDTDNDWNEVCSLLFYYITLVSIPTAIPLISHLNYLIYFSVRDTISLHQLMGFVVYGGSALPRLVLHSTRSTETLLPVQNLALHVETPLQKFSTLHTTKSGSLV